jgi:predicted ribosomally synthesized peptide with SipW-like signal peptide
MKQKRMLLGGAAIAVAMALVGVGVWAAFTDTETSNVQLDTGQLDIVGGDDVVVTNMAPGDVVFHDIGIDIPDTENDGNLIQSIDVSTALNSQTVGASVDTGDADPGAPFTPGSLWDGTDGIQVVLAFCDGPWTLPADGDPLLADGDTDGLDDSAVCDGGTGTITAQASQPLDTFDFSGSLTAADFGQAGVAPTGTIADGSSLDLIVQMTLPATADNGYENAAVDVDFVFEAIQRAGVNR